MTTSTIDAEAIARIESKIQYEIAAVEATGRCPALHVNIDELRAILSYLASRREAQEPVAWRYRWKIDGEWVSWRVSERSQASEHLPSLEEYPLYLAPPAPAGEVERLVKPIIDRLEWNGRLQQWVVRPDLPAGTIKAVRAALNGGRADE